MRPAPVGQKGLSMTLHGAGFALALLVSTASFLEVFVVSGDRSPYAWMGAFLDGIALVAIGIASIPALWGAIRRWSAPSYARAWAALSLLPPIVVLAWVISIYAR